MFHNTHIHIRRNPICASISSKGVEQRAIYTHIYIHTDIYRIHDISRVSICSECVSVCLLVFYHFVFNSRRYIALGQKPSSRTILLKPAMRANIALDVGVFNYDVVSFVPKVAQGKRIYTIEYTVWCVERVRHAVNVRLLCTTAI